jgi:glycosyltransferase involved in cell wall biosynthesis
MLPPSPFALLSFAWRFVRETWTFYRHMKRTSCDLVVVITSVLPAALFAARLRNKPAVVYAAEIFEKGYVHSRARTLLGKAIVRYTERLASGIVCCSETVASQFQAAPNHRIVATVYPGVRSHGAAARRESSRERFGVVRADPCLAVLGNLTRGRGQEVVIRALPFVREAFPAVSCIIAGTTLQRPADLAYERKLRSLVKQLGLTQVIAFVGFVDPVDDVYAAADIVINPALFNEPLGLVALEALAEGRPVVASRVGAIPEVLRADIDALLVDPNDPEAVAAAVTRLWGDAELRTRLVESGQAHVLSQFDERAGLAGFLRVVDEVLRARQRESQRGSA